MNRVNVIIPAYNAEKYISECLDSVLNQTYSDIFVICIDDGSTDQTASILDQYANKNKNLKVVHKSNGGPSSARNYALDLLKDNDELLMFIDADDVIENNYIEKCVSCMEKYGVDIVCTSFSFYKNQVVKKVNESYEQDKLLDWFEASKQLILDRTIQSHSHCKLYKANLWENLRYPEDIVSMEDQATIFKTFVKAKKVYLLRNNGYYYRQSDTSICSTELKTSKGITDSLIGYYRVCVYDYPEMGEQEKNELIWCAQQALVNCWLMMYPRFKKKEANEEQIRRFKLVKKYIRKNRLIFKFKPGNKKEFVKKHCYLLLHPFYKLVYKRHIRV